MKKSCKFVLYSQNATKRMYSKLKSDVTNVLQNPKLKKTEQQRTLGQGYTVTFPTSYLCDLCGRGKFDGSAKYHKHEWRREHCHCKSRLYFDQHGLFSKNYVAYILFVFAIINNRIRSFNLVHSKQTSLSSKAKVIQK